MRRLGAIRVAIALTIAVVAAVAAVRLGAQQGPVPGRNVNVNGGPTWVLPATPTTPFEIVGDPWRNQTVEPECDVSSRNPAVIVCGGVDYRLVDLPGGFLDVSVPPSPHPDSWNMIAQSRDGGLTWMSRPHPGHLLDTSGTATLLKGYQFTADPTIRFGAAGVMIHIGLAANRGDNALSAIYSSTWIHLNNHEYDPEPVKFTGQVHAITTGSSGQFRDRPTLALGEPTKDKSCTFDVPVYNPETRTTTTVPQIVPCTPAYVAYATFVGDRKTGPRSKIFFTKSPNMGKGWTQPVLVSEQNATNQGVQIVKIPETKKVLLFWRRGAAMDAQTDAIMMAVSTNDGDSFGKATVFAQICPFDQDNTPTRFRVRTMANATAGPGRAYVVWAERTRTPSGACNPDDGEARAMLVTTDGGAPIGPTMVDTSGPHSGHQIFPTVAVAAGKVHVSWMDFRDDASGIFQPFIDEYKAVVNDLVTGEKRTRHTADIYAAEAALASNPTFGLPFKVSTYIEGRVSPDAEPTQLQWNVPLARNFNTMRVPFHGDFSASRGEIMVPVDPVRYPGQWSFNFGANVAPRTPVFHDFWTDGRNMRLLPGGQYLNNCGENGTPCELWGDPIGSIQRPYTPPTFDATTGIVTGGTSFYTPSQSREACSSDSPSFAGTKNLDIYTSRTTQGLYAFAPWNNKSLLDAQGNKVQRAFPVVVENTGNSEKTVTLTIKNQPTGGAASFDQFYPFNPIETSRDVSVPSGSMGVATVYVKSTDERAPVKIEVADRDNADLMTTVFLNPDRTAPPNLLKPGQVDPTFDIKKYEGHDIEIGNVVVQDINFQSVSGQGAPAPDTGTLWPDASWADPGWKNPGWKNPGWKNPGWKNESWQEPGWKNQNYEQPGWKNPGWKNETVSDDAAQSGSSRYITARVVSKGECKQGDQKCANTYSAYNANVLVAGADTSLTYQLVVYKLYTTAATGTCEHKLVGNTQVVVNIPNYSPSAPDPRATFFLAPNEIAYVTLVAFAPNARVFPANRLPVENVVFQATPQAVNTDKYLEWLDSCTGGECDTPPAPPPAVTRSFYIGAPPLPTGYVGELYQAQTLVAVGGEGIHTWTVTGLPPGMYFLPDESVVAGIQITGGPTNVGLYTFTVQVTDESSPPQTATQKFNLLVSVRDSLPMVVADFQDIVDISTPGGPSAVARNIEGVSDFIPDLARDPLTQDFYALDYDGKRVLRVGRVEGYGTLFTFSLWPELTHPVAIAADSVGNIFVADNDIDKIYRFQRVDIGDGVLAWRKTQEMSFPKVCPTLQDVRMVIDGAGNLIVAYDNAGSTWATQILRVSPDLQISTEVSYSSAPSGTPVSQIPNRPMTIGGLAIDSQGNYVVGDYCWNCPSIPAPPPFTPPLPKIFVIDPSGATSRLVTEDVSGELVGNMTGLQVDPYDGSYVAAINSTYRSPSDRGTRIVRVTPNPDDPAASLIAVVWEGSPLIDASAVQFQLPVPWEPPVQPSPYALNLLLPVPEALPTPSFIRPGCEVRAKPQTRNWPASWQVPGELK